MSAIETVNEIIVILIRETGKEPKTLTLPDSLYMRLLMDLLTLMRFDDEQKSCISGSNLEYRGIKIINEDFY
jgi:hypothetical protein